MSRESELVVGTNVNYTSGNRGDSFLLRCTIIPQDQPLESICQQLVEWSEDLELVPQGDGAILELRTANPGGVIACLLQMAFVAKLVLENLTTAVFVATESASGVNLGQGAELEPIGLVSLVAGDGFVQIFRQASSLVVPLPIKSNSIDADEICAVIEQLPYQTILLTPNSVALWTAAEQIVERSNRMIAPRQVILVPTKTAPQGLAALTLLHTADSEPTVLAQQMQDLIARIDTGEVWQAVEDAEFDGVAVEVGNFIGLHDGRLVTRSHQLSEVVFSLLEQMAADESNTITLYYGDFITAEAAENLKETVRNRYADQSVRLAYGGQAYCHYILSTE